MHYNTRTIKREKTLLYSLLTLDKLLKRFCFGIQGNRMMLSLHYSLALLTCTQLAPKNFLEGGSKKMDD